MDLARQAAKDIDAAVSRMILATMNGGVIENGIREQIADSINSVGSLVSHEDAALLREVKRALARVDKLTIELLRTGEFRVEVISEHELRRAVEIDANATAALKSALDAAGVPDAPARMGEQV